MYESELLVMHGTTKSLKEKGAFKLWLGFAFYMHHIRSISWQSARIHDREVAATRALHATRSDVVEFSCIDMGKLR